MLTFNQMLLAGGLNPLTVRLLRHADERVQRDLFDAAVTAEPRFDQYQQSQSKPKVIDAFRAATHVASFVLEPMTKQTVFVGVWSRGRELDAPPPDPWGAPTAPGTVAFELTRLPEFDTYRGRVVIQWGEGTRAWVQRADQQDKKIVELLRDRLPKAFPGYLDVTCKLDQVAALPHSWAEALRIVNGVYLLVHRERGDQYIGVACGADGFLGRWLSYADGHGGNVAMRELGSPASAYDASILEVMGSAASPADALMREKLWKEKLGSRARGLNLN
jgi:hypothetical protein